MPAIVRVVPPRPDPKAAMSTPETPQPEDASTPPPAPAADAPAAPPAPPAPPAAPAPAAEPQAAYAPPAGPATPPPAAPGYAAPAAAAPLTPEQDKTWAMWSHIGGIIGFLPSLIIWLVFKDRGARTAVEAKEALNWQITFTIAYVALIIITSILGGILAFAGAWAVASLLGWLPFLLWVLNVVFSVIGGVTVNNGGSYRYPVAIRLVK